MVRLSTVLVGVGIVFVIVPIPIPIPGIGFVGGILLILLGLVLRLFGL